MKCYGITGYPRSRTAWLANFLTYGTSFCFHEAIKYAPPERMTELFASTGCTYVGTSDSALPFYIDHWSTLKPKLVIIERDPEESLGSLLRYAMTTSPEDVKEVHRKTGIALKRMKENYETLVVPYDDLTSPETCRQIWSYCVPGEPFNEMRWVMLDHLLVTVKLEWETREALPEAMSLLHHLVKENLVPGG